MSIKKIAVLGTGAVGKTSLTLMYVSNIFMSAYDPTIEDSYKTTVDVDGVARTIEIVDTAGQEEYSALRDTYIRTADGFVLVYSITSLQTFLDVGEMRDQIYRVLDREYDERVPIVVVGNKCDLEGERRVSREEVAGIAAEWGVPFMEVSARLKLNVKEVFETAVREVLRLSDASAGGAPGAGEGATAPAKRRRVRKQCPLF